ncbi:hypothetical protein CROQUDRAFT_662563 [Cronartium quercuum f. sp. fusiforme G11]|uniref:Uncharacterized protein n=1 Tax=Cronartium quercuum f. sp. fusiforme G11 TaxID=708437 RepID=A0A9P6T8B2_9BASI|nr:hypothetical protein CROQUDRAFT_662563 [Cronartium quercuum f. sp. fusiforme G11]
MAILDITLRLGSTIQAESSSQTSAVPALTNRHPIELSSSLPSHIFLVQSGSTVSSHPQPQSASPTAKATECCLPTEEELTTAFEDENSLYYDGETSPTVSSSVVMDEQDSESIEPQQDSFEKLEPVVPIPRCELFNLDTQSLKASQKSSSSERTLNSSSKSSIGLIQSETSTSLVEDHARSSGCLVFDHLKILLSQLDIPDNDSPKYHVAWAFDGRFTKPKPSAAFDSIAFEFKQMENDSTMPGENLKKKIDLLKIQRKSRFLVKLPSIELNQAPKFIKNISKTPSWAILKPLGPTTSVTFATATALIS